VTRRKPVGIIREKKDQFRETEVLELISRGMTNLEMATHFGVSLKTIQNHVAKVLGKLHVVDRTQAASPTRRA